MHAAQNHDATLQDVVKDDGGMRGSTVAEPAVKRRKNPKRTALLVVAGLAILAELLFVGAVGGYVLREFVRNRETRYSLGIGVLESWRAEVRQDPEDARARLGLATTLQASGEFTSALAEYDGVLSRYPHDTAALYGRSAMLMKLGRSKEVEAALRAVLAQEEGHVRAAEGLGDYYAKLKQYSSLLEVVLPAVEAHPTEARLQYLTGLAYENLDHRAWALARYRLALTAVPDLPEALEGVRRLETAR